MGLGDVEGVTHEDLRHDTTALFGALDVASGEVISPRIPRHRHQGFLAFLKHPDAAVPPDRDIHPIGDRYATPTHPKVKIWPARRPRYHMHFTPPSAGWLNPVERWLGRITRQAIRRGSFRSVREWVRHIGAYVTHHSAHKQPAA